MSPASSVTVDLCPHGPGRRLCRRVRLRSEDMGRGAMNLSAVFLGGLAMAAVLAGSPSAVAADTVTFRIGQSSPANTFLAIWMANDAGFYEANGLKLEV